MPVQYGSFVPLRYFILSRSAGQLRVYRQGGIAQYWVQPQNSPYLPSFLTSTPISHLGHKVPLGVQRGFVQEKYALFRDGTK
jgi:hypothetical protein